VQAQSSNARSGRKRWIVLAAVVLAAVVLAALLVAAVTRGPQLLQLWVYDNRPSGVSCENLPETPEVEAALKEHASLRAELEALDPDVEIVVSHPCDNRPGAAEILIMYPGGDLRGRIEAVLERESFGVPTSLKNV